MMTVESSNNDSTASEPARTSSPNLLDTNGTQVCHEHLFNRIDAETAQETQGVDNQNGPSMHAMGAFVLSPEEECIMESELIHLKQDSIVVKWWAVDLIEHCYVTGYKVVSNKTLAN